jgi:hypothetical protein
MTWNINSSAPHYHRHNAAERAIRTFKEHFLAWISSVDPTFPLHLWDRLLPQAGTNLNSCKPQDCIHSYPLQLTSMDSLITTKHSLRHQNEKSLRMRNQKNDELWHLTANMGIPWA